MINMIYDGSITTSATATAQHTSSYRVKFDKKSFLALTQIAKPERIYYRKGMHFFAYDGFVMYTDKCKDTDFRVKVLHAIEFSNTSWQK